MSRATRITLAATIVGLTALVATPAVAVPAHDQSRLQTKTTPATNFSGTVALSNCSGAIVRWSTSTASDPAMMLTNGHCYDFMGSKQVLVDQPSVRSVTILTASGDTAGTVDTTTLLYATMWQTDVALYQLDVTYQQAQSAYGVQPITIASTRPSPKDQAISVISGYWKTEYDCNLNGFAWRLHEYVWTWRKSLRYSDGGCQVIGGTSGSPVLDANRMEIGINNTINEDGEQCTLDNPCEQNRKGTITVHLHRGYGQETWLFYTCLTHNQLDLGKTGCKLPSPG